MRPFEERRLRVEAKNRRFYTLPLTVRERNHPKQCRNCEKTLFKNVQFREKMHQKGWRIRDNTVSLIRWQSFSVSHLIRPKTIKNALFKRSVYPSHENLHGIFEDFGSTI